MMKTLIIFLVATTASFFGFTQKSKMSQSQMDTTAQLKYTCRMHPNQISDEPGNCPVCGTQFVIDRKGSKQLKKIYTCPMHPNEVSGEHGKCPVCGADLVEKKPAKKLKNKKSEG